MKNEDEAPSKGMGGEHNDWRRARVAFGGRVPDRRRSGRAPTDDAAFVGGRRVSREARAVRRRIAATPRPPAG